MVINFRNCKKNTNNIFLVNKTHFFTTKISLKNGRAFYILKNVLFFIIYSVYISKAITAYKFVL